MQCSSFFLSSRVSSVHRSVRRNDEREDDMPALSILFTMAEKNLGYFCRRRRRRQESDPSISVSSSARTSEGRPSFHRIGRRRARMPARRLPLPRAADLRPTAGLTDWV